jgi:hypothetical protein
MLFVYHDLFYDKPRPMNINMKYPSCYNEGAKPPSTSLGDPFMGGGMALPLN